MKYNRQLFDKLISNNSEEEIEEVTAIIEEIKKTAFRIRTEQETKLFIQNHQRALIEQKNCDSVCEKCDIVLCFIETNFCNFVNDKCLISNLGKSKLCNRYSSLINETQSEMKSCLSEKLCRYLKPLTEPEKYDYCTIYYARYVSQFWKNWLLDFDNTSSSLKEEEVLSYLISQNFNPPAFFRYVIGGIIGELSQEDDPYIQEKVLASYNKRFNIIPAKIGNPFRPDYPDIKPLLEDWLNTEIKQCRKRQKKHNPDQQTIIPKTVSKIEMSMSVAQMAYFFKLLSDSGIIANKIHAETLNVLCEKFRSKKMETISYDSLHNKYYNVEDRTKESVKAILETLLNIE